MSQTWQHFRRINDPDEKAECIICYARLSCKGSSTSGLIRHLTNRHQISVNMYVKNAPKPRHPRPGDSQSTTNMSQDYTSGIEKPKNKKAKTVEIKNESYTAAASLLQAPVSVSSSRPVRMASDKIPRLIAAHDVPIRALFDQSIAILNRGLNKPTFFSSIISQYDFYKAQVIGAIQELKAKRLKFSLSFDFWDSYKDRYFVSIDVHAAGLKENIGLVRLNQRYDSGKLNQILAAKLNEFGLDLLRDIIGVTSNCSIEIDIMNKIESSTSIIHQHCYNKVIHQCLLDTFYRDTENFQDIFQEEESDIEDNVSDSSDFECESLNHGVHFVISQVRKIVYFFKDPANNRTLQTIIMKKHNKEMELLLDNEKTWTSIDVMLERFLLLLDCIKEAYLLINKQELETHDLLEQSSEIHRTLELMTVTMRALDKPEANLIRSEAVLAFMFKNLTSQTSDIASALHSCLLKQITENRNLNLISVLKYLTNKNLNPLPELPLAPASEVDEQIKNYALRFVDSKLPNLKQEDENPLPFQSMDLMERLEQEIFSMETPSSNSRTDYSSDDTISREIAVFHANEVLGENLTSLLDDLKTIRPSSTMLKKVFSTARKRFFTKWPGMSTETRDKLWFLRHQYNKLTPVNN